VAQAIGQLTAMVAPALGAKEVRSPKIEDYVPQEQAAVDEATEEEQRVDREQAQWAMVAQRAKG
jgi:hypothetical protein